MRTRRSNPDYLNGVPELLLLRLLAGRPMHGYELVRAIRARSGGQLEFSEGCIYPLLHRLEKEGAVEGRRRQVGNRRRVVYQLSAAGHARLKTTASRWQSVVQAVESVLSGGEHGNIEMA